MHTNSRIPLNNNTALWYYLGTKHLYFRCENNSTPGVLIKEIQYINSCIRTSYYFQPCILNNCIGLNNGVAD